MVNDEENVGPIKIITNNEKRKNINNKIFYFWP